MGFVKAYPEAIATWYRIPGKRNWEQDRRDEGWNSPVQAFLGEGHLAFIGCQSLGGQGSSRWALRVGAKAVKGPQCFSVEGLTTTPVLVRGIGTTERVLWASLGVTLSKPSSWADMETSSASFPFSLILAPFVCLSVSLLRDVFPQGLPDEYAFVTTFRFRKTSRKEDWYIWQVIDQYGIPQVWVMLPIFGASAVSSSQEIVLTTVFSARYSVLGLGRRGLIPWSPKEPVGPAPLSSLIKTSKIWHPVTILWDFLPKQRSDRLLCCLMAPCLLVTSYSARNWFNSQGQVGPTKYCITFFHSVGHGVGLPMSLSSISLKVENDNTYQVLWVDCRVLIKSHLQNIQQSLMCNRISHE